jgi:hypothetical protein
MNVTDPASFDLTCNLTNLRVLALGENGIYIPEVQLDVYSAPVNLTITSDINGSAVAHSLLPNLTYVLNASRYGTVFGNLTIQCLLVDEAPAAWYNTTITCPTFTLKVNVTDAYAQPISNAQVRVQDLMGGMIYSSNTDSVGTAAVDCTFGKYEVRVYKGEILLNETTVGLFQNQNVSINCTLYGLSVSIRVVDYFGQTVPNVIVTLQRSGVQDSRAAGADGRVLFGNIAGGELQVIVRLSGQSEPCVLTTAFIDNSTTIEIKVDKYVMLAGLLVETSQLITVIIIVLIVILILSVEILRRRRLKPQKSEKLESE